VMEGITARMGQSDKNLEQRQSFKQEVQKWLTTEKQ